MKVSSFIPWLSMVFCAFSIVSCSDDWEDPKLLVNNEQTISAAGGTLTIPIKCNTNWQVLSFPSSWVTLEATKGKGSTDFLVEVAANNSFARTGNIVIAANTDIQTIKLTQQASSSGTLSVTTGSCSVSGRWPNYTLYISFTIKNPHLTKKAGVIYAGKQYNCSSLSTHCDVEISLTTMNPYGGTYQAYAVNASTGQYVYGSTKTVSK